MNVFQARAKFPIDEDIIDHVPFLAACMQLAWFMDEFVFKQCVANDKVILLTEIDEFLTIFIQFVYCVRTDDN